MTDAHVAQLRRIVVTEVGDEAVRREQLGLAPLDPVDRRQMARSILRRELDGQWRAAQQRGELAYTPEEEDHIVEAVLAGLFSQLPGLESYLARRDVTDIFVVGCDNVRVRTIDGEELRGAPVAASDDELVDQVQALARKGGRLGLDDGDSQIEKEFSPARPLLDLQLSDGSRLAAAAWVSARPYVSVRRHPLVDADQDTLVRDWKMYDEGVASLFAAAMRARLNILVAGGMGRGKTTLIRALLHECPPGERIVVLEQERELQLGIDPARHDHVLELTERPANMEGRGAVTLADLTWAVKRHAPDRIVVGEVRGPEVMYMLEAACDGIAGTLCTLHARSSHQTFEKLVNYARRDGASYDRTDVLQTAAYALDLIVHLDLGADGRRVVAEITQVLDYDPDQRRVITNDWFVPGPDGDAVPNPRAPIPVDALDLLVEHGYEPSLHRDEVHW
jgi:pilus assembly protein CpaF